MSVTSPSRSTRLAVSHRARLASRVAASAAALLALHALGVLPTWALILAVMTAVAGWATWATCPPDRTLSRHAAGLVGQLVLDALAAALRLVVTLVLVLALLAASWSFLAPRIAGALQDRAASTVTQAVTPDLPGWLGDVAGAARKELTR